MRSGKRSIKLTVAMVDTSPGLVEVVRPPRTLFKFPETVVTMPMLVTTWAGVKAERALDMNKRGDKSATIGSINMIKSGQVAKGKLELASKIGQVAWGVSTASLSIYGLQHASIINSVRSKVAKVLYTYRCRTT